MPYCSTPSYGYSTSSSSPASVNTTRAVSSDPSATAAPARKDIQGGRKSTVKSKCHISGINSEAHHTIDKDKDKDTPYARRVKAGDAFRRGPAKGFVLLHDPAGTLGAYEMLYDNFKFYHIFEKVMTSEPINLPLGSLIKSRNGKPCSLPRANGPSGKCGVATTDGHYARHFITHLPEQIGYFWCCPACGEPFNRPDSLKRHCYTICRRRGSVTSERLHEDAKVNHFLRSVPQSR